MFSIEENVHQRITLIIIYNTIYSIIFCLNQNECQFYFHKYFFYCQYNARDKILHIILFFIDKTDVISFLSIKMLKHNTLDNVLRQNTFIVYWPAFSELQLKICVNIRYDEIRYIRWSFWIQRVSMLTASWKKNENTSNHKRREEVLTDK